MRRKRQTMLTYRPMTISKRWRWFWTLAFVGAVIWAVGWLDGGMILDGCDHCKRQPWFYKSHLLQRPVP